MAGWSLTVHDAKTGAHKTSVEPADSAWSTAIAPDGTTTETFIVNDADAPWPPGRVDDLFLPNDRLLARWWGDHCMYAQKVEDYAYEKDTGKVTVTTVDLITEAEWRLLGGVDGAEPGNEVPPLVVTNQSPRAAIGAAFARMMQWDEKWHYPIDVPGAEAGPISGQWEFLKKYRISDVIQQISERAGVEVYLRPYRTSDDGVRFAVEVAQAITVGTSSMNLAADDCPISAITYRKSGSRQVTGLLGVGNGTGEEQETRWQGRAPYLIPIRDTKQSFPDQTGDDLQQATDTYYEANRLPIAQWSVGAFTISDDWPPSHAAPGRRWLVESHGDPVIPDDVHPLRVIKVSGGNGYQLKTEVQSG
ncbi:hypothetical protein [Herbiconiux sp.]|uniref:hypothetical protein n=1 Tax=Herbiconiux sp. TaxID=1871186 RepID=UPI0025B8DA84|nr:hypothetical protein [Herbiconiux sp.]